MKRIALGILFTLFIYSEIDAQSFFNNRHNRRLLVSGGTGVTSYYGDLNAPNDYLDGTLNLTGSLIYMINSQVGIEAELFWYRIKGDDATNGYDGGTNFRNLSFVSNNQEISVNGSYYILPNGTRYYQRQPINPYVFAGIGITYFKPKADLDGVTYSLRQYQTEGVAYGPFTVVIPMGVGARVMLGPYFNFVLEAGYRKTFTDYLDDVSNRYVDNNSFDDPIAAALADRGPEIGYDLRSAGSRRGNPDRKDAYFAINAKVEFYLPSNIFGNSNRSRGPSRRGGLFNRR